MRLVFLGPPGAGKGTQAQHLEEKYGARQIATGDILRRAVQEETALGKKAKAYLDKGELVPDEVVIGLVAERLRADDCRQGFVLDGFPRTIAQAEGLEKVLGQLDAALDSVLCLRVPNEAIVQRLTGRRTCRKCGALYHLTFSPPRQEGVCDRCGGALFQREDDREETIRSRLKVYDNQTAPLVDYYRKKGLLREIDGVGSVEEIRGRIVEALGRPGA